MSELFDRVSELWSGCPKLGHFGQIARTLDRVSELREHYPTRSIDGRRDVLSQKQSAATMEFYPSKVQRMQEFFINLLKDVLAAASASFGLLSSS